MSADNESKGALKTAWQNFLMRLDWPKVAHRHWLVKPTLIRHNPKAFFGLIAIGCVISAVTVLTLDLALLNAMSSTVASRPLDVFAFVMAFSFLVGAALFFYPLLLLNHRLQVYVEEEAERLNARYTEGLQELQRRLQQNSDVKSNLQQMSAVSDYQDFIYIYNTALAIERKKDMRNQCDPHQGTIKQTYAQAARDSLRELIYATAWENVEDSAHSINSYLVPVTYCMAAVALGFITIALIPLLGTSTVQIGAVSINLTWAVGGFLGAYLYSFLPFFQRCTRSDLPPRAFLHYALNILLGTMGVAIFGNLLLGSISGSIEQLAIAAALGSVPFLFMAEVRKRGVEFFQFNLNNTFAKTLGLKSKPPIVYGCADKDLCYITGINYEFADRLREEGIMNIQNLAFADVDNLCKRTRLCRAMLFDWRDQAILILLAGDISSDSFLKEQPLGGLVSD